MSQTALEAKPWLVTSTLLLAMEPTAKAEFKCKSGTRAPHSVQTHVNLAAYHV